MKNNLVIRIGLNKCATTFLHRVFFAQHPEINHLGKPYDLDDPRRIIIETILEKRGFKYDLEKCHRLYKDHVENELGDKVTTLSDTRIAEAFSDELIDSVPRRLYDVFGECKIMVTIRNQLDLIESYYVQHLETRKLKVSINQWVEENWTAGITISKLIQYDKILDRYEKVFGKQNVLFLLLEDLRKNKHVFLEQISTFLSVSPDFGEVLINQKPLNPRMSPFYAVLLRLHLLKTAASIANVLPEPLLKVAKKVTRHDKIYKPQLSESIKQKIFEIAQPSNQNLIAKAHLSLKEHDYPV